MPKKGRRRRQSSSNRERFESLAQGGASSLVTRSMVGSGCFEQQAQGKMHEPARSWSVKTTFVEMALLALAKAGEADEISQNMEEFKPKINDRDRLSAFGDFPAFVLLSRSCANFPLSCCFEPPSR